MSKGASAPSPLSSRSSLVNGWLGPNAVGTTSSKCLVSNKTLSAPRLANAGVEYVVTVADEAPDGVESPDGRVNSPALVSHQSCRHLQLLIN